MYKFDESFITINKINWTVNFKIYFYQVNTI